MSPLRRLLAALIAFVALATQVRAAGLLELLGLSKKGQAAASRSAIDRSVSGYSASRAHRVGYESGQAGRTGYQAGKAGQAGYSAGPYRGYR